MNGDQIRALADGAARELGAGWAACPAPNPDGAKLRHADGRELFIWQDYRDRHAGRVQVQGCYPGGWRCAPVDEARIWMRASRGGTALASEIRRRLIRRYEADLAVAREKHAGLVREQAARDAMAETIMAAVPGAALHSIQPDIRLTVDLPGGQYPRYQAVVSADGSEVSLRLPYLPADAAVRVLAALYGSDGIPVEPARCGPARRPERQPHGRLRKLRHTVRCGVFAVLAR